MPPAPRAAQNPTAARLKQLFATHPFDEAAWGTAAAADLHVRIGNAAPVVGRDPALGELRRFFARVDSIGSGFCEMCRVRETIFAEMEVDFTDEAGGGRRIPCTVVARVAGGRVLDIRLHLDPSPIP